jgi:hypothetical protein
VAYRVQGAEALLPPGSCENVMNLLVALQLADVVLATDPPSPN